MNDVIFIKGQGGLGRPLNGQDFVSGLALFCADGKLPTGWTTSARIKALYSLADAINAGIDLDYAGATPAVGEITITNEGDNDDKITVKVAHILTDGTAEVLTLAEFKKTASESSPTLLAAAVKAAINDGTVTHGYSADNTAGVLEVTAPKRLGVYLNSGTPLSVTVTGTLAATVTTAFAGGVFDLRAHWYYQISEFFRMQPKGVLYTGFFGIPSPYTFAEITTVQNFSGGIIRQIGILKDPASAFSAANLTTIDTVCKANDAVHKPISALYAADLVGTADISTLSDLNLLSANKASAVIGMDGGGLGHYLFLTSGKSVPQLGALLGTVALSKVSENVGWVGSFNISDGIENEVLAFANGQMYASAAISESLLDSLNSRRYIFLKKFVGLSGSYWNDSHCAVLASSDYAYIENNRTIDKAIRLLYTAYLPSLNSPLRLNADGTLADSTLAYLEQVGDTALEQMLRDDELSAKKVEINPVQNVLTTSKLVVSVTLVINGVARTIEIPIGFKPKITQ